MDERERRSAERVEERIVLSAVGALFGMLLAALLTLAWMTVLPILEAIYFGD